MSITLKFVQWRYSQFTECVQHLLAGRCPECLGPVAIKEIADTMTLMAFEYRCPDIDCDAYFRLGVDTLRPNPDPEGQSRIANPESLVA